MLEILMTAYLIIIHLRSCVLVANDRAERLSHPQPMRIICPPPLPVRMLTPLFILTQGGAPESRLLLFSPLIRTESPSLLNKVLKLRYISFEGNLSYSYLCFASDRSITRVGVVEARILPRKAIAYVMAETMTQTTHESVSALFDVPLQIERYVHLHTILLNNFFKLSRGEYGELLWTSNTYKIS